MHQVIYLGFQSAKMSRGIVSAVAIATAGSVLYLLSNYLHSPASNLMNKTNLMEIIITLRKKMYNTLREIAYVVNYLKVTEGDLQPKKIKDIMLRSGGTGENKLSQIQNTVLAQYKVTSQQFQQACKYYSETDIEIKLLLQKLQNDLSLALEGTVETYNGPLPDISSQQTIKIYREVILRKMNIIQQRMLSSSSNQQCILMENQIQIYLEQEGVLHPKQANQKVFLALLERHYKESSEFKWQLQQLEGQLQEFIEEMKKKKSLATNSTVLSQSGNNELKQ